MKICCNRCYHKGELVAALANSGGITRPLPRTTRRAQSHHQAARESAQLPRRTGSRTPSEKTHPHSESPSVMKTIALAATALNQTPLAWQSNVANIRAAIAEARAAGATIVCLPELCLTGYGCEDAFLSPNTHAQAWASLREILPETKGTRRFIRPAGLPPQHGLQRCRSGGRWKTRRARLQAPPRRRWHPLRTALVQAMAAAGPRCFPRSGQR